ncbi:MAG: hypothetical protein EXR72_02615 [Myxococcales bacterium]|nr:hypothetical protein [Myxococcales bacterium]
MPALLLTTLLAASCGTSLPSAGDGSPADLAALRRDGDATADLATSDLATVDAAPPKDLVSPPDLALAKDRCRTPQDCKNGELCLAPGAHPGCGICMKVADPCLSDAQCKAMGAKMICEPGVCTCNGEKLCKEGCSKNGDCQAWQFCAPTNRCINNVCLKDKDCPANFACLPPNNPHCERKVCKSDLECAGFCIGGLCYGEPGTCMFPPP